jgi:hypothetical protein
MDYLHRRKFHNMEEDDQIESGRKSNTLYDYEIEEYTHYQYEGVIHPWRAVCNGLWFSMKLGVKKLFCNLYDYFDKSDREVYIV